MTNTWQDIEAERQRLSRLLGLGMTAALSPAYDEAFFKSARKLAHICLVFYAPKEA